MVAETAPLGWEASSENIKHFPSLTGDCMDARTHARSHTNLPTNARMYIQVYWFACALTHAYAHKFAHWLSSRSLFLFYFFLFSFFFFLFSFSFFLFSFLFFLSKGRRGGKASSGGRSKVTKNKSKQTT